MKNKKNLKIVVRFVAAGLVAVILHRTEKDINTIADAFFGSD